jgi:hypothetical protein
MITHLQNIFYIKLTGWDLTTGFSACEANTVSFSYTPCYVTMARHYHEAIYEVSDPFTNMLVFCVCLSDSLKAVDPFIDRIPRELHEQYMTDCVTEFMKMAENKTSEDGVTSIKYGLIIAFARKS